MSEAQGSTQKLCTVCGVDVNTKPRVKDASGRYMCKGCFDKARATKGAQEFAAKPKPEAAAKATPVTEEDNSFLLGINTGSSIATEGTKPCPECGRALTKNTVICVGCGFNTQTGKRMQVKVTRERAPKGEKAAKSSGGGSLAGSPHVTGIVVVIAWMGFGGVVIAMPDLFLVYVISYLVYAVVVGLCTLVAVWQESPMAGGILLALRIGGRAFGRMARGSDEQGQLIEAGIDLALMAISLAIVLTKVESILLRWLYIASVAGGLTLGVVLAFKDGI